MGREYAEWIETMRGSAAIIALVAAVAVVAACGILKRPVTGESARWTVNVSPFEPDGTVDYDLVARAIDRRIEAANLSGEAVRDPASPSQLIVSVSGFTKDMDIAGYLFSSYRLEMKKAARTETGSFKLYDSNEMAVAAMKEGDEVLPYTDSPGLPGKYLIVRKDVILKGDDIRDAQSMKGSDGNFGIMVQLKPAAAEKFGQWTSRNVGSYLAIVLDGTVISAPVIQGQIFDSAHIQGRFDKGPADQLALGLRSGSIPASLKIVDGPVADPKR